MIRLGRLLNRIKILYSSPPEWKEIEYFSNDWIERVKIMAAYIPAKAMVMDLGCGNMSLKQFLKENKYIPVDYCQRDETTIVCDFNRHEFPTGKADVIFISGCLEYIRDYNWLLKQVCLAAPLVILSYCTIDQFSDPVQRHNNHWQNHLSAKNIRNLFYDNGFSLFKETMTPSNNHIFIFKKH
jgi:hypothetical protein